MAVFSKLALPLLISSSLISAFPILENIVHPATHRRHLTMHGVEHKFYHPRSTYETYVHGLDHPLSKRAETSDEEAAIAFLVSKGIPENQIAVQSSYTGETASHVYLKQVLNGMPISNAVANVSFKDGKVISFGISFISAPASIAAAGPSISKEDAISAAEVALGAVHNDVDPTLEYVIDEAHNAVLAWNVQVRNTDHWYAAYVDAHDGKIVNLVDFVARASYRALPIQKQDPTDSGGFEVIKNPQDKRASPNGWHNSKSTEGNNVISYFVTDTGEALTTHQSSNPNNYNYKWNPKTEPIKNLDVARTNAFYVTNKYHDVLYRYGFTEKAFNFQNDNFGKGGAAGDRVEMQVQAPGFNNANFATPPDGQSGHCNMYVWTFTSPRRDSDLSNDVITHELTHGTTNRMTGGGTGGCLQTIESGGLGEGWSDAFAFAFEQKTREIGDFTLGSWLTNNPGGIRTAPYSIKKEVNSLTYSSLQSRFEVHDIGEVWAEMLYELFACLIGRHGFDKNVTNINNGHPDKEKGNIAWFHLVVDALALQPCNPTFVSARDAIIQADQNRYKGRNSCLIRQAFARRGLGKDAQPGQYVDSFDAGC